VNVVCSDHCDGPIPRQGDTYRLCVSASMIRRNNNPLHLQRAHCATSQRVAGSIPDVIKFFAIIFPAALWPWVRLSL